MTTKQWLSRARYCDREITVLQKAKDREKQRLLSITASLDGDTVTTTKDPHKFDRYVELAAMLDAKIDELYSIKQEVERTVDEVQDPRYRQLLRLRYVSVMTWEEIAVTMSYSFRQVCRMHGEALIAVDLIRHKMA